MRRRSALVAGLALALGLPAAAFAGASWPNALDCLTGADAAGPVKKIDLVLSRGADEWTGRLAIAFADSDRTYRTQLSCLPTGPGGTVLDCSVPCGGDLSIQLSDDDGAMTAAVTITAGLFADTAATAGKPVTLAIRRVEAGPCAPEHTQ